jgi:hypothetical protein
MVYANHNKEKKLPIYRIFKAEFKIRASIATRRTPICNKWGLSSATPLAIILLKTPLVEPLWKEKYIKAQQCPPLLHVLFCGLEHGRHVHSWWFRIAISLQHTNQRWPPNCQYQCSGSVMFWTDLDIHTSFAFSGSASFWEAGSGSASGWRIQICVKVKIQSLWRLKMEPLGPWTLAMEMWRLKCNSRGSVNKWSKQFDEDRDPDPDSHQS